MRAMNLRFVISALVLAASGFTLPAWSALLGDTVVPAYCEQFGPTGECSKWLIDGVGERTDELAYLEWTKDEWRRALANCVAGGGQVKGGLCGHVIAIAHLCDTNPGTRVADRCKEWGVEGALREMLMLGLSDLFGKVAENLEAQSGEATSARGAAGAVGGAFVDVGTKTALKIIIDENCQALLDGALAELSPPPGGLQTASAAIQAAPYFVDMIDAVVRGGPLIVYEGCQGWNVPEVAIVMGPERVERCQSVDFPKAVRAATGFVNSIKKRYGCTPPSWLDRFMPGAKR